MLAWRWAAEPHQTFNGDQARQYPASCMALGVWGSCEYLGISFWTQTFGLGDVPGKCVSSWLSWLVSSRVWVCALTEGCSCVSGCKAGGLACFLRAWVVQLPACQLWSIHRHSRGRAERSLHGQSCYQRSALHESLVLKKGVAKAHFFPYRPGCLTGRRICVLIPDFWNERYSEQLEK